jgi:hypothetical protein
MNVIAMNAKGRPSQGALLLFNRERPPSYAKPRAFFFSSAVGS